MSIIFGIRKTLGDAVEHSQLLKLAGATERCATHGTFLTAKGHIGMGFQPYHTHERSHLESQPIIDELGNMISLDGRLDNHKELIQELGLESPEASDSTIVLAALKRWGENCFSRFIGDWALALWAERNRSLYLARDHAGTRALYFENVNGSVRWSTNLDTFFVDGEVKRLDMSYAACYLSSQPIRDLTPYCGIAAVTPAHYLVFREGGMARKAHWQWMVDDVISYRTDKEYEERCFDLFRQSVERRIGSGAPIVAELSGGIDSTSTVCMSDYIGQRPCLQPHNLLDTISYFDDSEPNWNERPYFSAVESKRGKVGTHVPVSFADRTLSASDPSFGDVLWPGDDSATIELERRLHQIRKTNAYHVTLSGIGGDELLGGVPTPFPELTDYLVAGRILLLLKQAKEWCLPNRKPLLHMLSETVGFAWALSCRTPQHRSATPPWMTSKSQNVLNIIAAHDMADKHRSWAMPSRVCNGLAWWSILESLPKNSARIPGQHERRYPYLDRDFVDYIFRIPRQQLVRPGQRRSLMSKRLVFPSGACADVGLTMS